MTRKWFGFAVLLLLALAWLATPACAPIYRAEQAGEGEYLAVRGLLMDRDGRFKITDNVVYPERDPGYDPSTGVPDDQLTDNRCNFCHACDFKNAFDWDNQGQADWNPRYRGEEWQPVIQRMMKMQNSFLQEEGIVRRIFDYLSAVTTTGYDQDADDAGQVRIELEEDEFRERAEEAGVIPSGS